MNVLCIIPARGGSKGIPKKNVQIFCRKPLIAFSIEHAKKAKYITKICVSTDDIEIAKIALSFGAQVIERPAEISNDAASSESALKHTIEYLRKNENYEADLVVFLQATSPIRNYEDIDKAIFYLNKTGLDSLLSVTKAHKFLWRLKDGKPVSINYDYNRRPRRQELEPEYFETGSFYIFKPWVLDKYDNRLGGKIGFYEIDFWHSFEIDSADDFALCEWIYNYKKMEKEV